MQCARQPTLQEERFRQWIDSAATTGLLVSAAARGQLQPSERGRNSDNVPPGQRHAQPARRRAILTLVALRITKDTQCLMLKV